MFHVKHPRIAQNFNIDWIPPHPVHFDKEGRLFYPMETWKKIRHSQFSSIADSATPCGAIGI